MVQFYLGIYIGFIYVNFVVKMMYNVVNSFDGGFKYFMGRRIGYY